MTAHGTDEICEVLKKALLSTRNRRELLAALGKSAAASAFLAAFGLGRLPAVAQPQPVTAYVLGGVWRRALIEAAGNPFTKQTGIPMQYQDPYNWARLRAMHEAKAQQIDCASVAGTEIILAHRLNMAAPLDWNVIDRSALSPRQLTRPRAISCFSLAMTLCYNKNTWPGDNHPKSWADFWNVEKFPGRRSLRRDALWAVEVALLADGPRKEPHYPLDLNRAFANLERIKPHVRTWWSDNSQAQALMERQEVDLIAAMDGRASETIATSGAPYKMIWNDHINTGDGQGWIVLNGGPNPSGAMRFLDVVARPEAVATFARMLYYAPLDPKAYDYIDPEFAKNLSSHPDNVKFAQYLDYDWWADNVVAVQRRFERWLQS